MLHGSRPEERRRRKMKKRETARAAAQPMDRNENGFPLFPFPSTFPSVSLSIFFFFFSYILPFFTLSGFVSQGFRCVRGALHRRLFLYVHIDTKAAQRRMHITVPQARKRPSSVLIVFCCLYYSQFLFVFLHFVCLSVCLFVCLSVCLSVCL